MRGLPLLLVLDEVGSLLIKASLIGRIFLTAGTTLLDATEEDDGCDDGDNAGDGSDDGDLGSLGERAPAVLDTVRLLNLLQRGRLLLVPDLVSHCLPTSHGISHTLA